MGLLLLYELLALDVDIKVGNYNLSASGGTFEVTQVVMALIGEANLLNVGHIVITDTCYTSEQSLIDLFHHNTYGHGVARRTRVPAVAHLIVEDMRQPYSFTKFMY